MFARRRTGILPFSCEACLIRRQWKTLGCCDVRIRRIEGLGFRGLGLRVQEQGFRVKGLGFEEG